MTFNILSIYKHFINFLFCPTFKIQQNPQNVNNINVSMFSYNAQLAFKIHVPDETKSIILNKITITSAFSYPPNILKYHSWLLANINCNIIALKN